METYNLKGSFIHKVRLFFSLSLIYIGLGELIHFETYRFFFHVGYISLSFAIFVILTNQGIEICEEKVRLTKYFKNHEILLTDIEQIELEKRMSFSIHERFSLCIRYKYNGMVTNIEYNQNDFRKKDISKIKTLLEPKIAHPDISNI